MGLYQKKMWASETSFDETGHSSLRPLNGRKRSGLKYLPPFSKLL